MNDPSRPQINKPLEERTVMSKEEIKAAKAAAKLEKKAARDARKGKDTGDDSAPATPTAAGTGGFTDAEACNAKARTATGVLTSERRSRDVKISSFSLSLYNRVLVEDTEIELLHGHRYGLIGMNGCGKSTFLRCLAAREVPIPDHIDVYLLDSEAAPTELSALDYVLKSAREELARLEKLSEELLISEGPDSEVLLDVQDKIAELDESTFISRASFILIGLGFDNKTLHKKTKDMSGGWRMRVSLARALFISPAMLLLDEPTAHLDLEACVWLEQYLSKYNKILVIVSHSADFLDGVCTQMMVMQRRKLRYWGGNYSMYVKTREEQDAAQLKEYKKQQEFIKNTKDFIASCGTYANLVRQAKSRQKILDKMYEEGLIEEPWSDPVFKFKFPPTTKLAPPVISFEDVAFSYSGKKEDYLFKGLRFGIDSDSRIALVGPNGAGKSTLLKLMVGENQAVEGAVKIKSGVSIGRFHQHSAEILPPDMTPVEYIASKFQAKMGERKLEEWRSLVGQYGVPSEYHLQPIKILSDGLKVRLAFCEIALNSPDILLLDEPTNSLDMEAITSLGEAIKSYSGGIIVVSHDFKLLSVIADEIWLVDHGITKFPGDIRQYKAQLQKQMAERK